MIQRVFSLVMTDITGLGDHFAGPQESLLDNFDPIFLKILNDARTPIRIGDMRLRKLCLWRTDIKLYSSFKENSSLGPYVTRIPVVESENAGPGQTKGGPRQGGLMSREVIADILGPCKILQVSVLNIYNLCHSQTKFTVCLQTTRDSNTPEIYTRECGMLRR